MSRGSSQRLHEYLRNLISAAKPGDRLPSEPQLARTLGVARATLREAMRTFETQGLLYRRQGSGTYISHPTHVLDTGLEVLESIETLAHRIGLEVTMEELKVELRPGTGDELRALGANAGMPVMHVSRVIRAEGHPAAFLIDILPEDVLTLEELKSSFTGSVLDVLLRKGSPVLAFSRTEINAESASVEVSRALRIQRGDGLLKFTAYLYDTRGQVVDYSFSYFLPGNFKFHVVRRVGEYSSFQK
jgi:GntR family transcriptional regulator